jgi:hypothetical protein
VGERDVVVASREAERANRQRQGGDHDSDPAPPPDCGDADREKRGG